ncbi:MAG: archease [Longimicrobiales bacterium]
MVPRDRWDILFSGPLCALVRPRIVPDEIARTDELIARVEGVMDRGPRVREIKGVTLHDLKLERRGKGWYGRVIFDV